jgi:type I restriction enzyme S subunit
VSSRGWNVVRLGDNCSKIGSGSTPRGGDSVYHESGVSFIRSQNVYNGLFNPNGLAHLDERQADQLKGVTVKPGDVLLNITGDSVARSCRVPDDVLPARVNQHVAIIRPRPEEFDSRFVGYYFISPFMQSTMLSLAGGGGTRKALTKEMIEQFKVPQPPRRDQERIADVLSSYDDLIENNRRRMALLEDAARQLYREWFVRLRFPGREHTQMNGGVPEGWERVPTPEAVDINPTTRLSDADEHWFVEMSDVEAGCMSIQQATRRVGRSGSKFRNGDTLFARITPCLENGKTAFVDVLPDGDAGRGSTEFIVLRAHRVAPEFVYCLARTYDFREHAIKSMVGSSGRQRVQENCFEKFLVWVPSTTLLALFTDAVRPMFRQIKTLHEQNKKLSAARDLLLPRLMSGEIVTSATAELHA